MNGSRKTLWFIALLLVSALAGPMAAISAPIRIEYFYTEGCTTCFRVEMQVLPLLEVQYDGLYELKRCDIDIDVHYLRLAAYQEKLAINEHATSVLVVNGAKAFADWKEINTEFLDYIGLMVSGAVETPQGHPTAAEPLSVDRLESRVRNFTIIGVALAGLIDGVNPCAISTLVFFISMLGVMKVQGRRLVLVGIVFCITSFVTYIAIGFGLFRLLYLFSGFHALQRGLEWTMIVLLSLLALLSLRDALRYHASGRAGDVTIKLPRRVNQAIHNVIRSGLKAHHILWGSVATAFLVTVLESVCTGQVYVPTLVLVLRHGKSVPLVAGYLLLYNTLFILPLVLALVLAHHGTRTERFVHWSRENVVPSKVALAALFVGLAVLIALL